MQIERTGALLCAATLALVFPRQEEVQAPTASFSEPAEGTSTAWIRIVGAPTGHRIGSMGSTRQGFVTLGTERYQTTIKTTEEMSLATLTRALVNDLLENNVAASSLTTGVIHVAMDDDLDKGVVIQVSDAGLTRGVSQE